MKTLSSGDFLKKCNQIHNNTFIYDPVDYNGLEAIFEFRCTKHGKLQMLAKLHYKNGCKYCKKEKSFIKKSINIHKSKYRYDDLFLISNKTKINIFCFIHGYFKQTPDAHLRGQGCPKCKVLDIEILKDRITNKHGNKYIISNLEYKNAMTKFKVICSHHGDFYMCPKNLSGCKKCANKKISLSKADFIKKSNLVHQSNYDYSLVEYINNKKNVIIICQRHGKFTQRPDDHISGHGCKYCKISLGEKNISFILDELNIKYIREYKFKDCINIRILSFDFYLPKLNTCIEFNGKQHYEQIDFFGGEDAYNKTTLRDSIKEEYCKNNNIKLITIPYYEKNICKVLTNILC